LVTLRLHEYVELRGRVEVSMKPSQAVGWRQFVPVAALALIGSAALIAATLVPRPGEMLVAVFAADRNAAPPLVRIIEAGWLPVRQIRASVYLIAPATDAASVRQLGALAVISNLGLRGCS
jgi:hypothetical protein